MHRAGERPLHRPLGGALAARGELLNLTDEMSELTLEIVLRSIFGRDLDRLTQQLGAQSVRGRHQGAGAQPAVRLQVPLADQARGAASSRGAGPRTRSTSTTSPCS